LIAKHAAVTQAGGDDAATVQRVEDAIKNSPMGWLQSMMGEVDSRAASEKGQVQGKIAEQQSLVSQNQDKAPKEAGPAPAPGPATHPAVTSPTAAPHSGSTMPAPATGGTAAQHAPIPGAAVQRSAPAAAAPAAAPAPTIASAIAGAGSDSQLDGILNAYSPKAQQTSQTLGRIKQMGDIAQGFNGQLDVYVAQGGAVEKGIAATANFLGTGKDVSAVWANNPYRKVHGILGGIMTGLSAVKNVCSVVGNICGKLGIVLTVIGLLGMIFPPVGVAVSGIARILNVVGVICDAVSFALSGILTGLNGVVLAQQIASGASAEEKAATADLMMSEANDAASGFINMAMIFGPKFMKGMLSSSKGVVGALLRRAKAVIGRVSIKASGDLKLFASKVVRKLGFGGAALDRVGGAWKDTGIIARTKTAIGESRVGQAWNSAPEHLEAMQNKLMSRYGNTAFAKGLDRVGAWSGTVASKFDLEEKVGDLGERAGKSVGNAGADTAFAKRMSAAADQSELDTRRLAMQVDARDAAHLEQTRWQNTLDKRAAANPDGLRNQAVEQKFVAQQGARVQADATADFEAKEAKAATTAKIDDMKKARFERHRDEYFANETNAFTGKDARTMQMDTLHGSRAKRFQLEGEFKAQDAERADLLAKAGRSAEDDAKLASLNSTLRPLDDARHLNEVHEGDLAKLAAGGEGARHPDYKTWGDVGANVWSAVDPALQLGGIKDRPAEWQSAEKASLTKQVKFDKGKASGNAASRGGHGTFGDIATTAQQAQMADFSAFVRSSSRPRSLGSSVRNILSPVTNRAGAAAPQPVASAPAPASTTTKSSPAGPTPVAPPAVSEAMVVTPQVVDGGAVANTNAPAANTNEAAAPAAPAPTVASVAMAAMEQAAAEPLPYWPAMMPEFDRASSDFSWMRKVAVEFKKAQIEGKQKAVDTLAVYGRYQEYAKLRAAAAAAHASATQTTAQSAQQNVSAAGQSEQHGAQGEAKQGEARGAANDRAAVDLPEPESRGFWGRILGAVKRWAKDKAAQVFGWIQEKIASVVLKGLCGVSMGDMREYAGALKRQQAAAHGVATGAGSTAGQAQQTAIKLGSDATKEAQSAADAIGECDQNITDVDNFTSDVTQFEQQLAEEKAFAQTFLAQLHAEVQAQQAKQKSDAAAEAAADARANAAGTAAAAGGGGVAGVAMAAMTATAAEPQPHEEAKAQPAEPAPQPADTGDTAAIHSAASYVGAQGDSLSSALESRADDYHNQLKLALTNHTGKDASGVDLQGPAKKGSKTIVEEFKTVAQHTKTDMDGFASMSIDPSSAHKIADTIIQSADHLEDAFGHSEHALDDLFERTYAGIRDGKRTLKSRLLDGNNMVGQANHAGDDVTNKTIDTSLPTMTTAWNDVSKPIQVASNAAAPAAAPVQRKADGGATSEAPAETAKAGLGSGGALPHGDRIQAAFGRHDVSGIRAHTGAGVDQSAKAIGATAYATGDNVAFAGGTPDLHTAAHEAAHVVQQRGGVQLKGGIDGGKSDPHEQHADAVADAVVAGKSAEGLLDQRAGGGAGEAAVQRHGSNDQLPDPTKDPKAPSVDGDGYINYRWSSVAREMEATVARIGLVANGPFGAEMATTDLQKWVMFTFQQSVSPPEAETLGQLLAPEAVAPMVDRARKHDVDTTDENNPVDKDSGPASVTFAPGVAAEITNAFARRYSEAMWRVMPQLLALYSAKLETAKADASKQSASPSPIDPLQDRSELVPVHPVDSAVINAFYNTPKVPYDALLAAHPGIAKAAPPSSSAVKITFKATEGLFHWLDAGDATATAPDVAKALFAPVGELDMRQEAYRLISAPPLFGFRADDVKRFKPEHINTLRGMWATTQKSSTANTPPVQWPGDLLVVLSGMTLPAMFGTPPTEDPMLELAGRGSKERALANISTKVDTSKPHDAADVVSRLSEVIRVLDGVAQMLETMDHDINKVLPMRNELDARRNDAKSTNSSSFEPSTMYALADRQGQVLADIASSMNEASVKYMSYKAGDKDNAPIRKLIDEAVDPLVDAVVALDYPDVADSRAALGIQRARTLDVSVQELNLHSSSGPLDASLRAGTADSKDEQKLAAQYGDDLAAIRLKEMSDPAGATTNLATTAPKIADLTFDVSLRDKLLRLQQWWQVLADENDSFWQSMSDWVGCDAAKKQCNDLYGRFVKDVKTKYDDAEAKNDQAKKLEARDAYAKLVEEWMALSKSVNEHVKDSEKHKRWSKLAVGIAICVVAFALGQFEFAAVIAEGGTVFEAAVVGGVVSTTTSMALEKLILNKDPTVGSVLVGFVGNVAMFGIVGKMALAARAAGVAAETGEATVAAARATAGAAAETSLGAKVAGAAWSFTKENVLAQAIGLIQGEATTVIDQHRLMTTDEVVDNAAMAVINVIGMKVGTKAFESAVASFQDVAGPDVQALHVEYKALTDAGNALHEKAGGNNKLAKGTPPRAEAQALLKKWQKYFEHEREVTEKINELAEKNPAAFRRKSAELAKLRDAAAEDAQTNRQFREAAALMGVEEIGPNLFRGDPAAMDAILTQHKISGNEVSNVSTDPATGQRTITIKTTDGTPLDIVEKLPPVGERKAPAVSVGTARFFEDWLGKLDTTNKSNALVKQRLLEYYARDPEGAIKLASERYKFAPGEMPENELLVQPDAKAAKGDATDEVSRAFEQYQYDHVNDASSKPMTRAQFEAMYKQGNEYDAVRQEFVTKKNQPLGPVEKRNEPPTELKPERPKSAADHEVVSETSKVEPELVEGQSSARDTTAAAVPGSKFRAEQGRTSNPTVIQAEGVARFEDVAKGVNGIESVRKADGNTFVVTPKTGEKFTVRVISGPVAGDAVARTVVNPTKKNTFPNPDAEHPDAIQGRYVVQLNDRIDISLVDRALAHEVGEISAEQQLAAAQKTVGPDLLAQGKAPPPDAELSPHDRGRIEELRQLAPKVNSHDIGATSEMLALVEELGLRDGTEGAAQRRALVVRALGEGDPAVTALDETAKAPEKMTDPAVKNELDSVRAKRAEDIQARDNVPKRELHTTPDAGEDLTKLPPAVAKAKLEKLANDAAAARAAKSAETLAGLRAQAGTLPPGEYPTVPRATVGSGASLAARDRTSLLIDKRGRWQADAGDKIAQTTDQLRGLKDAGIGDPYQFAKPGERVPMQAVTFWQDSIAAQGPVIDGEVVSVRMDEHGNQIIKIRPADGATIEVKVEGDLTIATGFPPERLPGTPRTPRGTADMNPEVAVTNVKTRLQQIAADTNSAPAAQARAADARAALAELEQVRGRETQKGQREADMTSVENTLKNHHLEDVLSDQYTKAMVENGAEWNKLRTDHPDKFVLGDDANLNTLDAHASNKWIIGGPGGTSISAAEIILNKNTASHVTMAGDTPPPGLIDNDQFVEVVRKYGDPQTCALLKQLGGPELVSISDRFSLALNLEIGVPKIDADGTVRVTGSIKGAAGSSQITDSTVPPGYTEANNPLKGGAYVSSIGRAGQIPPVAAELMDSVQEMGGQVKMRMKYDNDQQYIGYDLVAYGRSQNGQAPPELRSISVTGAASRFPPWDLFEGSEVQKADAITQYNVATEMDAPSESGNFNAGYVASAAQAKRYADSKGYGDPQ
jgi:hypothetical protein